jgi:DNA-binding NarL/FixJ family response regulator
MAQITNLKDKKNLLNILIVDDHKVLRQGLKKMLAPLKKELNIKITEADSGSQAMLKINHNDFDLIIMDYKMRDTTGLEMIGCIRRFKPIMKIIILSYYDELAFVESVRNAGAKGYLLKDIEPAELFKAITTVLKGGVYYSSEIALKLMESKENNKSVNRLMKSKLTKREIEILNLVAMELSNKQISEKLFISIKTVDSHRQNLLHKLNVKNTAGLVKAAYRLNLFD